MKNSTQNTVDYLDGFQTEARGSQMPVVALATQLNNNEQYAGNVLQFFPTAEGYVKATRLDKSQTELSFNYIYNYTDHLDERSQSIALIEVCERSSVRLSYTLDPQEGTLKIVDENHYYPFGLRHEIHYPSSRNRDFRAAEGLNGGQVGDPVELVNVTETEYMYKYQGQERQDELGLNWDSFKWRNYDYAIGRFMSIDPLAEKYVYNSPYAFSENRVIDARELEGLEAGLLKILTKYGKKGYDYVARTVKGDFKPVSREQALKKLQNQETVYSTGSAKDAKNLMKQSTDKKVVRHDGHDLPNGKKGMDHYQKKSGDGSHVNYGVDKSVAPVVVASTSEEGIAVETKTEEKSTMQKISDFATETLESAGDLLGEFILGGGIPLLAPAPLGGGEQQWIENKNKRAIEQWQQQEKEKQEKEKTQD